MKKFKGLDDIVDDLSTLPDVLTTYEELIDEDAVASDLRIKGKVLETANTEQASLQYYYETRKAEVHAITKWLESQVSAIRGKHFKKYTEHYARELSDRQKDRYIDNEQDVLVQLELFYRAKELYEKYEAVCDAFRSRGFALRNITELRIRSVHDTEI